MGALDKVLTTLTQTIKMNERLESLADKLDLAIARIKEAETDIKHMDKRLIRIEALIELTQTQRLVNKK